MMRLLLLLLSCATLFAQRTPFRVNNNVVNNPNVIDSATVTWSVSGTHISAAASGSGGTAGGIANPESSPSAINGEVFVAAGTSGTNALPSSRTTNTTVLVQSNVGDGTNVFRVNAATTHTSGNLLEVQNNGTNIVTTDYLGGSFNGRFAESYWGGPADGAFVIVRNENEGFGGTSFEVTTVDDLLAPLNYVSISTSGSSVRLQLSGYVLMWPTVGASTTPYKLDTSVAHTSGNLVEVKNNTTNKFTIAYNGDVSTPGIVSADGGAFTNTLTLGGVTVSTASAANPTATIGLTAVNGSATTFLRSDGAPALPATGGAYSGSILVPWVGTNNAVTLRWRKAPQVWEFNNVAGEWTALNSNSGSSSLTSASDGQEIGLWTFSTGILTNGVAGMRLNLTALLFGSSECAVSWRIKTPPALSSDADGYEMYAGTGDAASGTDGPPTDGAFFYYLHSVSNGVWCAKTINNTTATFATGASSTPPAVTAGAWWDLLLYGTSTTINFFVSSDNGATWAYIGSSSSNIPSAAGRETSIQAYIRKVGPNPTGTTAELMSVGRCVLWPM